MGKNLSALATLTQWLHGVADPVRLSVLRLLSEVEQATMTELAEGCRTSDRTLRRHLDAMIAIGLVEEQPGESDGQTPGRPATRFSLEPAVRDSARTVLAPGRLSQPRS